MEIVYKCNRVTDCQYVKIISKPNGEFINMCSASCYCGFHKEMVLMNLEEQSILQNDHDSDQSKIAELQLKNKELVEALKPFADESEKIKLCAPELYELDHFKPYRTAKEVYDRSVKSE